MGSTNISWVDSGWRDWGSRYWGIGRLTGKAFRTLNSPSTPPMCRVQEQEIVSDLNIPKTQPWAPWWSPWYKYATEFLLHFQPVHPRKLKPFQNLLRMTELPSLWLILTVTQSTEYYLHLKDREIEVCHPFPKDTEEGNLQSEPPKMTYSFST